MASKNPVTHVGKLYNGTAMRIAAALARQVPVIGEGYSHLVSRIGKPVSQPQIVDVRMCTESNRPFNDFEMVTAGVANAELASISSLLQEFVQGRIAVCPESADIHFPSWS